MHKADVIYTSHICTLLRTYLTCVQHLQAEVRWAAATMQEHAIATRVQSIYRGKRAKREVIRAAEYIAWHRDSAHLRSLLLRLCYLCLAVAIGGLIYLNLVFGVMFDINTCRRWLLTSLFAVLIDAFVQQPVVEWSVLC